MNIMSCEKCGTVVDGNHVKYYPQYGDDDEYHPNNIWDGMALMKTWICPVCKSDNASKEEHE